MNQKQIDYIDWKSGLDNQYELDLVKMGFSISVYMLGLYNQIPEIWGAGILTTAYLSKNFYRSTIRKILYLSDLKKIKDKNAFPLENAEKIIIDDSDGLEYLLEKTRNNEKKEWGAVLKTYPDKENAVIYEILDSEKSKKLEFIKKNKKHSLKIDIVKITQKGYNGFHHYHPTIKKYTGAENFTISLTDKVKPNEWINLLTFNLEGNPEIIGYNRRFVYIPSTPNKKRLIKATTEQILEYLK